jgi:pantoate--beta-alanine ligase
MADSQPNEVIRDPIAMRERGAAIHRAGKSICVVPTMGFLHDGHLALLRDGRQRADVLILTIFVNPTQFGPNEDLDRYPRDEAGDLAKARECGADLAFCPESAAMYAPAHQTWVTVEALSKPLCGASRPIHFRGVATIVTKLFNITQPDVAVFGNKDFQQLTLIRRMTADLDFGIDIVGHPIVREADGLAMSSRNAYLSAEQRAQALVLSRGLGAARELYSGGERDAGALLHAARACIDAAALARIDYIELRCATSLEDVAVVDGPAVMAMAVFFGKTRLIDNTVLG